MKTMFTVTNRKYMDIEGRYSEYETVAEKIETFEKAQEIANAIVEKETNFPYTKDYEIIATTINEETFEVTEKVVKNYNHWKEVGRFEEIIKMIDCYKNRVAELEKSKNRCRTENGIAKKDKEIAFYKGLIEREEKKLAEK